MIIKEGMQDTHMSMYAKFVEEMNHLVNVFGMSEEAAARIVAYRERTSVLDHRLAAIAEALENRSEPF